MEIPQFLAGLVALKNYIRHFRSRAMNVGNGTRNANWLSRLWEFLKHLYARFS
jgi:hypothetical protein